MEGVLTPSLTSLRDQITDNQLTINDVDLSDQQNEIRLQNHVPSAQCKSNAAKPAVPANVQIGSLVYLKKEGDKFKARESYIVTHINDHLATLQKFDMSGKFMTTPYEVPLEELLPAVNHRTTALPSDSSSSDSEEEQPAELTGESVTTAGNQNVEASTSANPPALYVPPPLRTSPLRVSTRQRREPAWLRENIWDRK